MSAERREKHRLGAIQPPGRINPTAPHGLNGYTHYGCRCGVCREANRTRHAKNRENRKARLATADVPHGSASTYGNWGCRCEPCRDAWRAHLGLETAPKAKGAG
jgi:hypothetical protein